MIEYIKHQGRDFYLLGTAHISRESIAEVREAIERIRPQTVCLELCAARYESISNPERWKQCDIFELIRKGRLFVLMSQLALASYQKQLGAQLDVRPGDEMRAAAEGAKEIGSELLFVDRDIKVTLKRAWRSLRWRDIFILLWSVLRTSPKEHKIEEPELERLKDPELLKGLLNEFADSFPALQLVFLEERNRYMAKKIVSSSGASVLAVLGAAHVAGVREALNQEVDLRELEQIPRPSFLGRLFALLFLVIVLGIFAYGFISGGRVQGAQMVLAWALATGCGAAFGALVSLAQPLTVLVCFLSAPLTTLHPALGVGFFAALSEAWLRKPQVKDFEEILDDICSVKGVFKNRLAHLLLVVLCSSLGAILGMTFGVSVLCSYLL